LGAFPLRLLSGHSNADPSKPLVALGQNYLCHSKRRQELADDEAIKKVRNDCVAAGDEET